MKKFKEWLNGEHKTPRRILAALLILCIAAGVIYGVIALVKSVRREAVNVYAVSDFAMTDYYGDSAETYGVVTTDKLQKLYISDTQSVKAVFVKEGQNVKKGDKLLSYDTTLSSIDLERAKIALEKSQLSIQEKKDELALLQRGMYKEQMESEKFKLEAQLAAAKQNASYVAGQLPTLPYGSWTDIAPRYVDAAGYLTATGTSLLTDTTALGNLLAASGLNDIYAVLVTVDPSGEYTDYAGYHLVTTGSGFAFETFSPDPLDPQGGTTTAEVRRLEVMLQGVNNILDEAMTYAQWQVALSDKENEIKQAEIDVKLAQLDLNKKEKEVGDGVVYSEIDGVVKAVRDATEAYTNGEAVVEVSGGGGYYITGSVSELALDTVTIGQSVQVNSWMTGAYCKGEVVEIGTYPTESTGWSDGNTNVSWYPLKVFVGEDADLQENDGVSMTYQAAGDLSGNKLYLENMFIRTENGKSYVMVRGENGLLEQRFIQTGRDLWGSYTQVNGGLTVDDYVAFPYGQDTVNGARTTEATMDQLYGGLY